MHRAKPALVVVTGADRPDVAETIDVVREWLEGWPFVVVST